MEATADKELEYKQLIHDLRSPIQALKSITSGMISNPSLQKELLLETSNRLEELLFKASKISKRQNSQDIQTCSSRDLSSLIEQIALQKTLEYPHKQFKIKVENKIQSHQRVSLDKVEFKRLISNILNNSIEALNSDGKIGISLFMEEQSLMIKIKDNGHGIPEDLLECITNVGKSHNKPTGQGLGLYHAKKTINSWNGGLNVDSILTIGTIVSLKIPSLKVPLKLIK